MKRVGWGRIEPHEDFEVSETHIPGRESLKRKAEVDDLFPHDATLKQVISPTGGLEFFANKPKTGMSRGIAADAPGQSSLVAAQVAHVEDNQGKSLGPAARGKGKGGIGLFDQSSHRNQADCHPHQHAPIQHAPKTHMKVPPPTGTRDDQASPTGFPDLPPQDCLRWLPTERFHVTVCRKESAPVQVMVCPGATIGQLSQAESHVAGLSQPLVIKTLTGIPLPLNSYLTPAAWYAIDNGASHSIPKCSQVHAQQHTCLPMRGQSRFQGLLQQGPLVAVDEMIFYVQLIRNQGHTISDPIVLDSPADAEQAVAIWVLQCLQAFDMDPTSQVFMVPLLYLSHWSPLALHASTDSKTLLISQDLEKHIMPLVTEAIGTRELDFGSFLMPSEFAADCGFQTVSWFFAHANGADHPKAIMPAQADQWRVPFALHISSHQQAMTTDIRLGGTMQPDQLLLQSVLKQHGVHQDRLATCASSLIQQLGSEAISKALGSSQPWKDLKTLATQASPPIRIVLASEIDAAVKARLATGKPMGTKANKKQATKGPQPQVIPTADQIKLPDAIFAQPDGQKLPSIPLHRVEAHSQGVALCNISEVIHFLSLTAPISSEGVALLILDHADPRLPAQVEHIRVPAMSATSGEPMLVSAALLQLGAKKVIRHVPTESFALEEIQTRVLKVLVYQDEWNGSWATFLQHPVRAIFEHGLMRHPDLPQTEHIIDVWDRQTLDSKMARAQASQAEVFAFLIRVTDRFADHIIPGAAVDGIYLEPRTLDGRKPDPSFRVIWMPKQTLAQVRLARSQTEAKTTIVRMGNRFGLRVDSRQAEQVHMQHRSDLVFLDGSELRPYKVGPFPYGSTKASISKGFKHLGWNARPVQPISQTQVQEGIFWQVTAAQEPTHWIYQMKHGDTLIAKFEDQKESTLPTVKNIIASKQTISKLANSQQEMQTDPWLKGDPWQAHSTGRKTTQLPPAPTVTPSQLAALEQRLEQKIAASNSEAKEEPMQVDQTSRIVALEQQVSSLAHSFSAFQGQQAKINQQIASQLQGFEGRIDSKLEDQMQRIESLLSKKMRHE